MGFLLLCGHAVALYLSLQRRNSLPMVLIHMLMGWFYVCYAAFRIRWYDAYQQYKDENR